MWFVFGFKMPTTLKTTQRRMALKRSKKGPAPPKTLAAAPVRDPNSRWITLGLAFALVVSTLAVYHSVGGHPFVDYDDQDYVTNNAHVKAGLTWDTFFWAWTATQASNWHPVTWLSHAADCDFYGLNPSGHHWTSLLIHAFNAVLLFLLLAHATGARWRSLFVAALFALHPLNVESVAWIAERKNVVSTLFFLLALGAYGWYTRKPDIRRYLLLAALFALGLASKPMVITLPFVLMLLDFWPLGRIENWTQPSEAFPVMQAPWSRLVLEKLPLLALSVGSAIITVVAQQASEVSAHVLPPAVRLETAFYAYGTYLWKMIWPLHLALIYPHPGRTLATWKPLLGAILLVIVSLIAWMQRKARPYIAVGWLWYLGTAVPIIGIVQVGVQVVADRYAYIPLIGIFVILAWLLLPDGLTFDVAMALRGGIALLIIGMLSFLTWQQLTYWQSTIILWTHALEVTENNTLAENFLSNALFSAGDYRDGMLHLRNYARLEPLDPAAHARVAADYEDSGQLTDAALEYEKAIRANEVLQTNGAPGLDPRILAITYANLGITYAQLGDQAQARHNAALALDTNADAIAQMETGLAQNLGARPIARGYLRLGMLLALFGKNADAQQAFARAQQLDPSIAVPPGFGWTRSP
jgi:hypothetical protein